MSREIPPMMVIGEAAGLAAALALRERITPRQVDVCQLQERLLAQGADRDPGPGADASQTEGDA